MINTPVFELEKYVLSDNDQKSNTL